MLIFMVYFFKSLKLLQDIAWLACFSYLRRKLAARLFEKGENPMSGGRIAGKRAIITGAGNGIGRAAAIRFAREGAMVGLVDINSTALDQVLSLITAAGCESVPLVVDGSNEDQVYPAVDQAVE